MAEESEIWQEIRDALYQLTEEGGRQTALLERVAQQGERRGQMGALALNSSILAVVFAGLAFMVGTFVPRAALENAPTVVNVVVRYVVPFLFVLGMMHWVLLMMSTARRNRRTDDQEAMHHQGETQGVMGEEENA